MHLALKPCCLPPIAHAQQAKEFALGRHRFPACHVCANGRWSRGRWTGSAGREEVERKFHCWVDNLFQGVVERDGHKAVEVHQVQASWFQNSIVLATRDFCPAVPESVLAFYAERRAEEEAAAASLRPGETVTQARPCSGYVTATSRYITVTSRLHHGYDTIESRLHHGHTMTVL